MVRPPNDVTVKRTNLCCHIKWTRFSGIRYEQYVRINSIVLVVRDENKFVYNVSTINFLGFIKLYRCSRFTTTRRRLTNGVTCFRLNRSLNCWRLYISTIFSVLQRKRALRKENFSRFNVTTFLHTYHY